MENNNAMWNLINVVGIFTAALVAGKFHRKKIFVSRLIYVSLLVLSVAICCVALEGISYLVLKVGDEGYYNQDFKNSIGLRDPREPLQLQGKQVIMAIGDSFTYGLGVRYQSSYPSQLEAMLRSTYSDVAVVNAGIPGIDTKMALDLLKRIYSKYEPSIVVLGFTSGDVLQNQLAIDDSGDGITSSDANFVDTIRNSEKRYPKLFLMRTYLRQKTATFALMEYLYKNYMIKYLPPSAAAKNLGMGTQFQNTEHVLDEMCKFISNKNKTKLVILNIVPLVRFDAYPYKTLDKRLEEYAQSRNIHNINPLECFSKHSSSDLWVSIRDGHYNAEGNRVLSEAVSAYLIKHNLLADDHPGEEVPRIDEGFE